MCNEQYPCVSPIELLCTINITLDGILNLRQSTIRDILLMQRQINPMKDPRCKNSCSYIKVVN